MIKVKYVCHIVSWYPNKWNNQEAVWTKRHIDGLNDFCINDVYHIEVREGKWKKEFYRISDTEKAFILFSNTKIWFIKELLTTFLLLYVLLFKINKRKYDLFNFQIAYPLLTYSKLIVWIIKKPIIVTEHWSAYHFNFGVTKNLKRIKRIFYNKKLTFIVVSKALQNDIQQFSGVIGNFYVLNNVIETEQFKNLNEKRESNTFFALSFWKEPKDPFLLIQVVNQLKKNGYNVKIHIGGFGPLIPKMEKLIKELHLENEILLLGQMSSSQIVEKLNQVSYFLHCSNYETASVVCMESLCCGTPVIASDVGGIKEYITSENGVLVSKNDIETWYNVIRETIVNPINYDFSKIQIGASQLFSKEQVSKAYYDVLTDFINK